ncbi:hypothetical protein Tsubulata_010841 [Turnera subulata]|uniref:CCHC-type domain-containing protein n=1 Tax=Turnera subulata TaxID=218843 RepID=A0A9Q0G8D4_9ROSI|nr:hypothetical protein Tsubulata_010841 [Turnera subulata]
MLATGQPVGEEEDPWALEEEVEVEDGDILIEEGENGENIVLSATFKQRLEKPWEKAVIVKLLGREIGYRALQAKIRTIWNPTGPFKIIDLENNFYIVRFWDSSDYYHALTGGPWAIFQHALSVQPWHPDFRAETSSINRAVVWVRFQGFPVNKYHTQILRTMGNRLGSTLKIDIKTESQTRAKFATVAVAVDLSRPLKGKVWLDGECFKVIYEGLPQICFSCGRYGHSSFSCQFMKDAIGGEKGKEIEGQYTSFSVTSTSMGSQVPLKQPPNKPSDVGEWMVVPTRPRRPPKKPEDPKPLTPTTVVVGPTGSRY